MPFQSKKFDIEITHENGFINLVDESFIPRLGDFIVVDHEIFEVKRVFINYKTRRVKIKCKTT